MGGVVGRETGQGVIFSRHGIGSNPKELKHRHQGRYLDTLGMLVSTVSLYASVQFSQFCPVYVAYFALSLASSFFFDGRLFKVVQVPDSMWPTGSLHKECTA